MALFLSKNGLLFILIQLSARLVNSAVDKVCGKGLNRKFDGLNLRPVAALCVINVRLNGKCLSYGVIFEREPLYEIKASIASDLDKINRAIVRAGRFLLASNELDSNRISNANILLEYKQQTHVEGGFRFMKSDEFELNHIFFKNT